MPHPNHPDTLYYGVQGPDGVYNVYSDDGAGCTS
jgi:hypothetical protein